MKIDDATKKMLKASGSAINIMHIVNEFILLLYSRYQRITQTDLSIELKRNNSRLYIQPDLSRRRVHIRASNRIVKAQVIHTQNVFNYVRSHWQG